MSGGITRISPNEIISELSNWALEANSPYNDGWTAKHYEDQLNEVFQFVDNLRKNKKESE